MRSSEEDLQLFWVQHNPLGEQRSPQKWLSRLSLGSLLDWGRQGVGKTGSRRPVASLCKGAEVTQRKRFPLGSEKGWVQFAEPVNYEGGLEERTYPWGHNWQWEDLFSTFLFKVSPSTSISALPEEEAFPTYSTQVFCDQQNTAVGIGSLWDHLGICNTRRRTV